MWVSHFLICQFSPHIPVPTVCNFHFSRVLVFLAIFQVLQCTLLIFHVIQCFSPHSRLYSVCVSFSTFFYFLAIFHVLQFAFRYFHIFHCFSSQSRSYSVCFLFSTFFKFFTKIQVLIWVFLIFHVFHCFHNPDHTVCVSHFTGFSVFSPNPGPTFCISHISRFQCFSPQSRSYSVCCSFWLFFRVSHHIFFLPCEFLIFSFVSFLPIFQFLQCAIFIFHVF